MTATAIKLEMEDHGITVIFRTIETVVDGDTVDETRLNIQRAVLAHMKRNTRGT